MLQFAHPQSNRDSRVSQDMQGNCFSLDTSAESEAIYFALLRKKTPVERLEMLSAINRTVKNLVLSGLTQQYPNDDEIEIKIKLAKILHGEHFASVLSKRLRKEFRDER